MDLIQKLHLNEFNKLEEHNDHALLQKNEFTATENAAMVPDGRTKIYEILPNLISKGLCTEINRDNKKFYQAVEPSIALNNLFSFYEKEVEDEIIKKKETLLKKKESLSSLEKELNNLDRKSTRLNSSHVKISYAVFC